MIALGFLATAVRNLKQHVGGRVRSEGCAAGIAVGRREENLLYSLLCSALLENLLFPWAST